MADISLLDAYRKQITRLEHLSNEYDKELRAYSTALANLREEALDVTPENLADVASCPHMVIEHAKQQLIAQRERIASLEATLRQITTHAVIKSPETPFERGYNDGTYMARTIASRALGDD